MQNLHHTRAGFDTLTNAELDTLLADTPPEPPGDDWTPSLSGGSAGGKSTRTHPQTKARHPQRASTPYSVPSNPKGVWSYSRSPAHPACHLPAMSVITFPGFLGGAW